MSAARGQPTVWPSRPGRTKGANIGHSAVHKNVELTMLREKLLKIGTKVVHHGRDVTFQMAEVASPRHLLIIAILRLIDELRPTASPP